MTIETTDTMHVPAGSLCAQFPSPPLTSHVPRAPRHAPMPRAASDDDVYYYLCKRPKPPLRWSGPTRTARRARRSRGRRGSASPSCHSPRAPTAHAAHTTRAGTRCPSPCRGAEPLAACAPPPPPRRGPRRGGARPHAPAPCSRSRWRGQAKRTGGKRRWWAECDTCQPSAEGSGLARARWGVGAGGRAGPGRW